MKKLVVCLQALLLIAILPGCDGPKKSNTQNAPTKVEEAPELSPKSSAEMDAEKANTTVVKKERNMDEKVMGSTTIENMVKNITQKLALNDAQVTSLKNVLTKSFSTAGYSLDKEYGFEEIKKFRAEILHNSADQILGFLEPDQQTQFKKFLNH